MKKKSTVSHEGVVTKIENAKVSVNIISKSACSKCHAKDVCGASDKSEKIIEGYSEENLSVGDNVMVELKIFGRLAGPDT